jgi:hypothetical protein
MTPDGRAPDSEMAGMGVPVVVTVKVLVVKVGKDALLPDVIARAPDTVSVKLWVALGLTPLCAVTVIGKAPVVVGCPDRVAVPLPLSMNVTVDGRAPDSEMVGVGLPVVVTENVLVVPTGKDALLADVIAREPDTVNVKLWVALGLTPLLAAIVIEKLLVVEPERVAVKFPLSWKVTPDGGVPVSEMAGIGSPVVRTKKLNGAPEEAEKVLTLAMTGAAVFKKNACENPELVLKLEL